MSRPQVAAGKLDVSRIRRMDQGNLCSSAVESGLCFNMVVSDDCVQRRVQNDRPLRLGV